LSNSKERKSRVFVNLLYREQIYLFINQRTVDIIGSISLLLIFSPLLIAAIIAIKIIQRSRFRKPQKSQQKWPTFTPTNSLMMANARKLLTTDPKFKKLYNQYQLKF
jgi:hypothetical protein